MRFDSQTWNYGSADFRPDTDRSEWEWHECHNHFHSMEEFVHYDILNETTGKKIAEGHKASFCLEDSLCVRGRYEIHRGCVHYTQGISAGCADLYGIHLDCQWIDVTGIVPGNYTLRLNSNPSNRVLECDYCNNIAMCSITLRLHPYGSLGIYVNHCHVTSKALSVTALSVEISNTCRPKGGGAVSGRKRRRRRVRVTLICARAVYTKFSYKRTCARADDVSKPRAKQTDYTTRYDRSTTSYTSGLLGFLQCRHYSRARYSGWRYSSDAQQPEYSKLRSRGGLPQR